MSSFEKFTGVKEKNVFESLFGCDSSASPTSSRSSSIDVEIEDSIVEKVIVFRSTLFPNYPIQILERKSLGIAHQLWPAASFLGDYIAANSHVLSSIVKDSEKIDLIELGAGLGLSGLFLANYLNDFETGIKVEKVILTDLPEAVPGLLNNIQLNNMHGKVEAQVLCWGTEDDIHQLMAHRQQENTIIIAADVVYWESLYLPLIDTLNIFCNVYQCTAIIAHIKRWKKDNKFFGMCKKRNLIVEMLCEEVHTKKHEHTDDEVKEIRRIYKIYADPQSNHQPKL